MPMRNNVVISSLYHALPKNRGDRRINEEDLRVIRKKTARGDNKQGTERGKVYLIACKRIRIPVGGMPNYVL